jgi:hypothetical protein
MHTGKKRRKKETERWCKSKREKNREKERKKERHTNLISSVILCTAFISLLEEFNNNLSIVDFSSSSSFSSLHSFPP